jgi:hypothetical protein
MCAALRRALRIFLSIAPVDALPGIALKIRRKAFKLTRNRFRKHSVELAD